MSMGNKGKTDLRAAASPGSISRAAAKIDRGLLESKLLDFETRFPVSGRIVQALTDEFGGVTGLATHLERHGHGPDARLWMTTQKPVAMEQSEIRGMFDGDLLDRVARKLEIPLESVEVQAALGIPKFFSTVSLNRDDFLSLGFSAKKAEKESRSAVPLPNR
jgi:uncharacterized protein YidB (DUF937 family)